MRLTGIEWYGYKVPFRRPFVAADKRANERHGLLLRLETDTGIVGWGEASPVGPGDEQAVGYIASQLSSSAPLLLGAAIEDEHAVRNVASALVRMPTPLRFGMETALYDLLGEAQGRSIASLLGGAPRAVPVNALIATDSPEEAAREAREAVAEGFGTLKLKVGAPSLDADAKLVAAVRQAAGPQVTIRIDANGEWSVPQAVEAIRRLEQFELEYVEQPVPANDPMGLAEVRRAVATPIAADESLSSTHDARRLIEMDAADVFVVKATRLGLMRSVLLLHLAKQAGKAVVITSSLEAGVGVAASLHLAATLSSGHHASGLATGHLLESDLLINPLTVSRGMLHCPGDSGLGITLDEGALAQFVTGIRGSTSM